MVTKNPFRDRDECSNRHAHTERPSGYVDFFDWASEMSRTHTQVKCPVCGYYAIWVKKAIPLKAKPGVGQFVDCAVGLTDGCRWPDCAEDDVCMMPVGAVGGHSEDTDTPLGGSGSQSG